MHIENIDVARSEFLEARFDGKVHRFVTVAGVIHFDLDAVISTLVIRCVLFIIDQPCISIFVRKARTLVAMTS